MKFTAYSPITGQVLFRGEASDPAALESDSVAVLEGHKYEEDGWIEDGEFNPLPNRPRAHHIFNYTNKQWEDPRTLDDIKQTAFNAIEKWNEFYTKEKNKLLYWKWKTEQLINKF